jgi:hypothetical protein
VNPNTLWLIKISFQAIAGLFGVLVAIFTFLDSAHDEKQENIKAWFKGKWEVLNSSSWLSLPEKATSWLLNLRRRLPELYHFFVERTFNLVIFTPILFFLGCWFN